MLTSIKAKISKYIGDRAFYKMILSVAVPIMIQNGVTNLVNLLDNIMVGSVGTEAMEGVTIVNQYTFIFNLLVFGIVSAAGIFTAQYYGSGDRHGIQATFRVKFYISVCASVVAIAVLALFRDGLINLFITEEGAEGDIALTVEYAKNYLFVTLFGLLPYAISQSYASTMRETGQTVVPMVSSIIAVATNFIFNSLLIFGLCGFPKLGVVGAAIATAISRYVELAVLVIYAHTNKTKCAYFHDVFKVLTVPPILLRQIIAKGFPLMANEFFWGLSKTLRNQCYSTKNLDVVGALNIASTINDVFTIVYIAMGVAVSIVVGNLLGEGKFEEAKDTDRKMIAFSLFSSAAVALILIGISGVYPQFYNTTDGVKGIASYMIVIFACFMPLYSLANSTYYTLRSGGRVLITILLDSVYMWVIVLPVSFGIANLTGADIYVLFAISQCVEGFKGILGLIAVKKGTWLRRLVS